MALIAGVITGMCVCVFGIWAFLKGQGTMLDIAAGAKPVLFNFPAALSHKSGESDLPAQLKAMFKDTQDRQDAQ